jgi:cytoskeletal protein RodZ
MSGAQASGEGRAETSTSEGRFRSWYDVLEIQADASGEEIEKAYKRAVRIIEGQSVAGYLMLDDAARSSARSDVEEAYAVLRDPEARARFDAQLSQRDELSERRTVPGGSAPPAGTPARRKRRRKRRKRKKRLESELGPAPTEPARPAALARADETIPVSPAETAAVPSEAPSEAEATVPETPALPEAEAPAAPAPAPAPSKPKKKSRPLVRFLEPEVVPAAQVSPDADTLPAGQAQRSKVVPRYGSGPARVIASEEGVSDVRKLGGGVLSVEGELPEGPITGETIRSLREERGLSVRELADKTHIRKGYIEAIEGGHMEDLPARVYLRGFLTQVARVLKVNKKRLADGYLEHLDS